MMEDFFGIFVPANPYYLWFRIVNLQAETLAYKSKVFKLFSRDLGDPFKIKVVSSAYWDIRNSSPSIFKPCILSEFLINIARISAHIMKIYGERGSPCLHPRSNFKLSDKNPFWSTLEVELLYERESKAFSKSIITYREYLVFQYSALYRRLILYFPLCIYLLWNPFDLLQ